MDKKLLTIGLVVVLLVIISSGVYATGFHKVIKSTDGEILPPQVSVKEIDVSSEDAIPEAEEVKILEELHEEIATVDVLPEYEADDVMIIMGQTTLGMLTSSEKLDGASCTKDTECKSGNCRTDYDTMKKYCAVEWPYDSCVHDDGILIRSYNENSIWAIDILKQGKGSPKCNGGHWSYDPFGNNLSYVSQEYKASGTRTVSELKLPLLANVSKAEMHIEGKHVWFEDSWNVPSSYYQDVDTDKGGSNAIAVADNNKIYEYSSGSWTTSATITTVEGTTTPKFYGVAISQDSKKKFVVGKSCTILEYTGGKWVEATKAAGNKPSWCGGHQLFDVDTTANGNLSFAVGGMGTTGSVILKNTGNGNWTGEAIPTGAKNYQLTRVAISADGSKGFAVGWNNNGGVLLEYNSSGWSIVKTSTNQYHALALSDDGKVAIVNGGSKKAEIYNGTSGKWSTVTMPKSNMQHATLNSDGSKGFMSFNGFGCNSNGCEFIAEWEDDHAIMLYRDTTKKYAYGATVISADGNKGFVMPRTSTSKPIMEYEYAPKDPYMDFGGIGAVNWNYTGRLTEDKGAQTIDINSTLNYILSYNCSGFGTSVTVVNNTCVIDIELTSGSAGMLILNNLDVQYTAPDITRPAIGAIAMTPNPVNITDTINISVDVTDDVAVDKVLFRIDNGTYVSPTGNSGDTYWYTGANTNAPGNHTVDVWTNDTTGNFRTSTGAIYTVISVPGKVPPVINTVWATPNPVNKNTMVTLTANVTDNIAVGTVQFEIGSKKYTATNSSGDLYWYTGASTSKTGTFSFKVYANDSNGNTATPVTGNYTVQSSSADTTAPVVTLVGPANGTIDTDGTVTFLYTVNDMHGGIAKTELIIDGKVVQTDTSVTEGINQNFTAILFSGNHTWSINATDDSSNANKGSSVTWDIGVSTPYGMYLSKPAGQSVKAKTNAVYTITINNIGLNADTYNLAVNNINSADTAALNVSNITLPATSSATFTLTVMDGTASNFDVEVSAISTTNATINDSITIRTKVTSPAPVSPGPSFGGGGSITTPTGGDISNNDTAVPPEEPVELRYLDISIGIENPISMDAGTEKTIQIEVQNRGNVKDVFGISLSGADWATLNEGQFTLEAGETRQIELVLRPPADEDNTHTLTVTVNSKNFGLEGSATGQTIVTVVGLSDGGPTGFMGLLTGNSLLAGLLMLGLIIALYTLWYQTSKKKGQITPKKATKTEKQVAEEGLEEEYQKAVAESTKDE